MDRGTGRAGESYAARLLERKGYQIVKRNYSCRFGEIDIIAKNRFCIVFVEVKTREEDGMVKPFEAITPQKQKKILLTAGQYLVEHRTDLQPRFDAIAVYTRNGKIVGDEHLENAFTL